MSELPPHWRRAAANALWPHLRRAHTTGVWPRVTTDYRTFNDVPNHHTSGRSTASGFKKQLPRHEPVSPGHRILARIDHDKWPGGQTLGVYLWKEAAELAETLTPPDALAELHYAYAHSTARAPFILDRNRHNTPVLRRHNDPRALITLAVAKALELTAAFATVEVITPELEDAFFRDEEDVPEELIQASLTFAIAQRAGLGAE